VEHQKQQEAHRLEQAKRRDSIEVCVGIAALQCAMCNVLFLVAAAFPIALKLLRCRCTALHLYFTSPLLHITSTSPAQAKPGAGSKIQNYMKSLQETEKILYPPQTATKQVAVEYTPFPALCCDVLCCL
jgi:hypothetical protein